MVLVGRVAVGHGGMAGVPGFGEKTQVRKAQAPDQSDAGLALRRGVGGLHFCVNQHACEQRR
jgi:hypothetical protein